MKQISTPTMGLGTTRLGTATGMLLIISVSTIPVEMGLLHKSQRKKRVN